MENTDGEEAPFGEEPEPGRIESREASKPGGLEEPSLANGLESEASKSGSKTRETSKSELETREASKSELETREALMAELEEARDKFEQGCLEEPRLMNGLETNEESKLREPSATCQRESSYIKKLDSREDSAIRAEYSLVANHKNGGTENVEEQLQKLENDILNRPLSLAEQYQVWYQSIDWKQPQRRAIAKFLDGGMCTTFMTVLTFWALYAEDIKVVSSTNEVDDAFAIAACFCLVMFTTEWVLSSYAVEGYLFSFFFYLDFVATISLVTDIYWLMNLFGFTNTDASTDPTNARAGRAARVGTRAGRIVRVVRFLRIGKLVKQFTEWLFEDPDDPRGTVAPGRSRASAVNDPETDEFREKASMKPSNLGTTLSSLITKKVIIGILCMIFVLPFLQPQNDENYISGSKIIKFLDELHANTHLYFTTVEEYHRYVSEAWIPTYVNTADGMKSLVYLFINEVEWLHNEIINQRRLIELERYEEGDVVAIFDIRNVVIEDGKKNLMLTSFLIVMLTGMALMFSRDTNLYVVGPVEEMVASVKQLMEDPMAKQSKTEKKDDFEIGILHGTITKIAALLRLGFGEAGAEVIKANLSTSLNAKSSGRKVTCIFAFCDIRNFTDATECLEEGVMKFVNTIATIVHSKITRNGGWCNKNVGDAFLLGWSIPDEKLGDPKYIATLTELSLITLIEIIVTIHRTNFTSKFALFRENERILARFGPGWQVRLGWGLHKGWAIEGAIGSRYKIDASYLSCNVNLSEDLEGATKFYGVPFLVSEATFVCMSHAVQARMRKCDRVRITGIDHPFNLYTFEIWEMHEFRLLNLGDKDEQKWSPDGETLLMGAGILDAVEAETPPIIEELNTTKLFTTSALLRAAQKGFTDQWRDTWANAIELYIAGSWGEARTLMEKCVELLPTDSVAAALLSFMGETDFKAPGDWKGVHFLH